MDSTTNQPSGSSSSNDVAEPSSALSALQAKIFSAFDSLVQYSTTLKAKFGGEADPRMIRFTSDVAAHLPTSLETLEDARDIIHQNLNLSAANLQVVLYSATSHADDNDSQNAPVTGQPISKSAPSSPKRGSASHSAFDTYSDANGRPRAFPTTFFPTPRKNALRRSYAVNDIYDPVPDFSKENKQPAFCSHHHHCTGTSAGGSRSRDWKGKAKDSAQGTNAPPADAGDLNEDDDAEAVAQALSAFDTPDEDYYAAGSKTAKGKGEARAKSVERRDDEDTAGPSVARAARARPRSKVAHAAAEGSGLRSTRRGPSDASQAQAGNLPRVPLTLPNGRGLKRADAFNEKSHPKVFWQGEWGTPPPPSPTSPSPHPPPPPPPVASQVPVQAQSSTLQPNGSTTICTAGGVPLRRSTRNIASRARTAEEPRPVASSSRLPPAGRGTKRRAQEDADADEDEDEDDDAAEASPKKKAKRTAAKKPRATRRTSRK
ncbi:hypothetical protein BDN71DRAFT_675065 [Pleurotus eryngii]|uniref:Uncharacterized protein n=1 Tax=Pleurotus eryngii TaxID=5323 RepID=A0A9P5ZZN7_PLEER|nr:hypothetical protein BDN71DRAFT_675065 [Pleurotus eryngii]